MPGRLFLIFRMVKGLMGRVAEVSEDTVKITIKDPKNKNAAPHAIEIPAGFVLWSTGIGVSSDHRLDLRLIDSNATPDKEIGRATT